jgi:hypothetical protein
MGSAKLPVQRGETEPEGDTMMNSAAIRGDFNAARGDLLAVSLKYVMGPMAPGALSPGDQVVIVDADGNYCRGVIEEIRGSNLANVRLDWDSWVSEEKGIAAG